MEALLREVRLLLKELPTDRFYVVCLLMFALAVMYLLASKGIFQ